MTPCSKPHGLARSIHRIGRQVAACSLLVLLAACGAGEAEDVSMIQFAPALSLIEVIDPDEPVRLGEPVLRSGAMGMASAAPQRPVNRPKPGAPPFVSIPVEGTGPGVVSAAPRKPVTERIAESQRTGQKVQLKGHELFELLDREPTQEERANPRLLLR